MDAVKRRCSCLGSGREKVLRKIFCPARVGDDYRFRTNRVLYELFTDMNVAKRINNQRFRWLGHVVRMDEDAPPRRVFMRMLAVSGGWDDRVRVGKTTLKRP